MQRVDNLLDSNRPESYFSFFKSQALLFIENSNKLENNQMITFAKKADKFLNESNYTESLIECFARTFESFIFDKVKKNNIETNILAKL